MGNGKCDFVVLNLSVTGGVGTDSETIRRLKFILILVM